MYEIPKMKVKMVQEGVLQSPIEKIKSTTDMEAMSAHALKELSDISDIARNEMQDSDREIFGIINIADNGKILNWNTVGIGNINKVTCDPRDAFKTSILSNAAAIFMFHCHPNGDPTPSQDDIEITKIFIEAGALLKIPLVDSMIVGCGTEDVCSLRWSFPELFGDDPYVKVEL